MKIPATDQTTKNTLQSRLRPVTSELAPAIAVAGLLLIWIQALLIALVKMPASPRDPDYIAPWLLLSMFWQGILIFAVGTAYRIQEKTDGVHEKLERIRFKRDVKIFLVLLFILLVLFIASRVRAQADPLLQSIGPDVALLPPLSAALPFTSPETPADLAAKAPPGVPPISGAPTSDSSLPPPIGAAPACNSSACLQAAINAGDVLLPQGDYTAANIYVPSNRSIAGTSNLVTIRVPFGARGLVLRGTTNSSIRNLTFIGVGNAFRAVYSYASEFGSPIELNTGANHNIIDGNRFQGCIGDTCIILYGGTRQADEVNYNRVTNNTGTACGLYLVAVDNGNFNLVKGNWANDCSIGAENDLCGQTSTGNQFVGNVLKSINGIGWNPPGADHKPFITGGSAACPGAYHNIVSGNTLGAGVKTFACAGCTS
jgi:hypothetical protein